MNIEEIGKSGLPKETEMLILKKVVESFDIIMENLSIENGVKVDFQGKIIIKSNKSTEEKG